MGKTKRQLIKDKQSGNRHSGKPAKSFAHTSPISIQSLIGQYTKDILAFHQKKK